MKKGTMTKSERVLRMAAMNGFKRIGTMKNELDLNEANLMQLLGRLQRKGMLRYQIIGRGIAFQPAKKTVAMFV